MIELNGYKPNTNLTFLCCFNKFQLEFRFLWTNLA